MKLYLVKSKGFRSYVVAENTEKAWDKMHSWLEEHDYGYYWDREFASIELIASKSSTSPKSDSGLNYDDLKKTDILFV